MTPRYVEALEAEDFLPTLQDESVDLLLTDPPFYGIVDDHWDNKWGSEKEFAEWLSAIFLQALPKITPTGSLVFFAGLGRHKSHPLFRVVTALEDGGYTFRNWITWKKRRAYGKSHDYLYLREEILWFSKSPERTGVTFHKPYTEELRGYAGFDPDHPALSEYKRAGNVWSEYATQTPDPLIEDITELFKPKRSCQKPPKLMDRLVETHSDPGHLIVDPFSGWGSTGIQAVKLGRRFRGCEAIKADADAANERVSEALRTEGPQEGDVDVLGLLG
jgi:DNA modification methylase